MAVREEEGTVVARRRQGWRTEEVARVGLGGGGEGGGEEEEEMGEARRWARRW